MHYLLFYQTVEGFIEKRAAFRSAHLDLVKELVAKGQIIMGGAMADPADEALIIFECEDESIPQHFVQHDPYVINALVKSWHIRPWNVAIKSN